MGEKSDVQTTQGLKILALENKLRVQVKYYSETLQDLKKKTFKELEIINLKRNHQQNLAGISQVSEAEGLRFKIRPILLQALFKLQSSLINKEKVLGNGNISF